ncbi:acyl dehydratase [Azospirillum baldaniorum]|uniref:MaoC family dehydratase n=1 Tax=Azospirillum baldaniorum TaxID=1064539 RepID=UPI00119EDB67|nr:MaoC family dehydratase [Azospirillum baldaniorum]TWA71775.1 acyl dehydratase [Azospirillum baldaniorum]
MRYLDDLTPGDRFNGGPVTVTEEDIVAFARQFDPQPFHLDPEAARDSVFDGLAASGWHTAGLTMRMIVTGDGALAGGFVGMGVEDIRWPKPTRPGDVLRIESEILEVRVSAKHPDRGIARVRTTTLNQDGETVQQMTANLLVPRCPGTDKG